MGLFDKIKSAVSSPKSESKGNNKQNETSSKGSKNFSHLDKLIHSGSKKIILYSDIVLGRREDSKYLDGIDLDVDGLFIDGNGHTIDAKGKTRIFYCSGTNITLKNIIFKGAFNDGDGGAINNRRGELTIVESTFIENGAKYGGGIYNDDGKVKIIKSTFKDNRGEGDSSEGAAIYNSAEMIITDSTLSNNVASSAGAIKAPIGTLTIVNSRFLNNRAEEYEGGAIGTSNSFASRPCYLSIEKSTFEGNSAQSNGGTICDRGDISKSKLDISESIFSKSEAKSSGGVIYVQGELNISDSKIIDNRFENREELYNNGNVKISNSEFSNNVSSDKLIYNSDSMSIENTSFKDNRSKRILENFGHSLGVFYCEFLGNDAEDSIIHNTKDNCTIDGASFENSNLNIYNTGEINLNNPKVMDEGKTIQNYGYIYLKSSQDLSDKIEGTGKLESDLSLIPQENKMDFSRLDELIHSGVKEIVLDEDISLESYEKTYYEGGIELDVDDLVIDGNGHKIDGCDKSRIFIVTGSKITLKNIIFENGHSFKNYDHPLNDNGGAIKVNGGADLTIEGCKFISNSSEGSAGAIYNSGKLKILKSDLSSNDSKHYGGCIYNRGILSISQSKLLYNKSAWKGGAIYDYGKELNISDSTLSTNSTGANKMFGLCGFGGAIYSICSHLNIDKSSIVNNKAPSNGAAISLASGSLENDWI